MSAAASGMAEGSNSEWSDVDSGQEEEAPQVKEAEADEEEAQWKDLSGGTEDGAAGGDVGDLRIDLGAAKPRRTLSARMGKGRRLRQRRLKGRSKLAKGITKKRLDYSFIEKACLLLIVPPFVKSIILYVCPPFFV